MLGIVNKIYREKDIEKVNFKIRQLGQAKIKSGEAFITLQLASSILVFIILLILRVNIIINIILTIFYFISYYYIRIVKPLKDREKKLEHEALIFFEVLQLTLESGKNLLNSLKLTCYNVDGDLSNEFRKSLKEVEYGRSLMEALTKMRTRIPSETVSNIILNMVETSIFGNSIVESISNQIDFLREKEIMDAKAMINKIPNKVSIISVLFIVPLILLIILGPFIMKLL